MDKFELAIRQFNRNHKQPTLWDSYDLKDEVCFSKTLSQLLASRSAASALMGFLGGDPNFSRHEVDTEVQNVDVLVRTYDPDQEILIENKIFSDESEGQIQRYVDRFGLFTQFVLFVTPDGRDSLSYQQATPIKICDLLELINVYSDPILDQYRYAMSKIVSSSESDAELLSIYDEFSDVINRMNSLVNERKQNYAGRISAVLQDLGFHVILAQASRIQFRLNTNSQVNISGNGSFANDPSLARMEMFTKNEKDLYVKYVVGPGTLRDSFIDYISKSPDHKFHFRDKRGTVYTQAYSQFMGSIDKFEESIKKIYPKWLDILNLADKWVY